MSKICQCRQQRLLKYLYSRKTPLANELVAAQIIQELESDCVCEKKETVTKSDQLKGTSHGVVRDEKGEIIAQCRCPSHEKEKQSQPPCEKWNHSFIENKLEGRTLLSKNYHQVSICM